MAFPEKTEMEAPEQPLDRRGVQFQWCMGDVAGADGCPREGGPHRGRANVADPTGVGDSGTIDCGRTEMISPNYIYRCVVTRVVDGDTVDADIDLGFKIIYKERIRLMGIDTPESRTRNKVEKALGLASKARLKELLKAAEPLKGKRGKRSVYLQTSKEGKGKFGRILGTLWVNNQNVNDILIAENHARPYFGGGKNELGTWTKRDAGTWYRWTPDGYVAL